MKNIHLIPTDKLSRLVLDDTIQQLRLVSKGEALWGNQNIYITSDEEIKSGDWCINLNSPYQHKELCRIDNQIELERYAQKTGNACRKIILTTDQDLINDGVQLIDDEFLEWFVKNPSCKIVEVNENITVIQNESLIQHQGSKPIVVPHKIGYKIIIPQEKSITYEEFRIKASTDLLDKFDKDCLKYSEDGDSDNHFYADCKYWEGKLKEESKQETHICKYCKAKTTQSDDDKQEVIVPNGYYDEDSKDFETASLVDFTDDEQEEPKQELNSLVESWQKKQKEYEALAEKHRDCEHTYKKYTYRAQATRDCWKELLTFNKTTEDYYDDFKMIEGEKIEEAAKRFWKESKANPIEMAIFGAEWQQEQDVNMVQSYLSANLQNIELLEKSYSEQEVDVLIHELINEFTNWSGSFVNRDILIKMHEQLKKK
jgi:hypothetical protein